MGSVITISVDVEELNRFLSPHFTIIGSKIIKTASTGYLPPSDAQLLSLFRHDTGER